MWSVTEYPVQRAVADFHEALYSSSVALRHLHDFHDDNKIMEVTQQEKTAILDMFRTRNSNLNDTCKMRLEEGLGKRLDIHIGRYLERNRSNRVRSEELLETNMDYLCKDFRTSMKMRRSVNPNMKMEEFEKLLEIEKQKVLASFRRLTKSLHLKLNARFEDRIDDVQKELLTKHKKYLDEEEKSLKQVRMDILEMSKELMIHAKSYTYTRNVAPKKEKRMDLDEVVEDMYNHLLGAGNRLKESHPVIYDNLLGILGEAIKFLREMGDRSTIQGKKQTLAKRNTPFTGVIPWARNLEMKLRECFGDDFVPDFVSARSSSLDLEEDSTEGAVFSSSERLGGSHPPSVSQDPISDDVFHLERDGVQKQALIPILTQKETFQIVNDNGSVKVGAKRGRLEASNGLNEEACPPVSKKLKGMKKSSKALQEPASLEAFDYNVPDKNGRFPLLQAILDGQSVESIQKMMDSGADVNIRANDDIAYNAAHYVICSLILENQNIEEAIKILDMLVSKGFHLINERSNQGFSPLLLAMYYEDLNEDLLTWFHRNGADFDAVGRKGNSVLVEAIYVRKSEGIIRKILDYGGNLKHRIVSERKWNALHVSARHAHESALNVFIDQIDVNERTVDGRTPLHLLFLDGDLDYQPCLKMLLEKKPDFGAKDNKGYFQLTFWMKQGKGNVFPTLMKLQDQLPITPEIASASLTAIVEEMHRLQKFLAPPTKDTSNEFVQFVMLLIEEKRGTLRLKDKAKWELQKWGQIKNVALTPALCKELQTSGGLKWKGRLIQIKGGILGKLDFHTKGGKIGTVPVETFLICLLHCKNFSGFVELCQSLKSFCESVPAKK